MGVINRRTERSIVRVVHLVVGVMLGTFVYLPSRYEAAHDALRWSLMLVGVPLVVASGIWLWKGGAIRRWWAGRASAAG